MKVSIECSEGISVGATNRLKTVKTYFGQENSNMLSLSLLLSVTALQQKLVKGAVQCACGALAQGL